MCRLPRPREIASRAILALDYSAGIPVHTGHEPPRARASFSDRRPKRIGLERSPAFGTAALFALRRPRHVSLQWQLDSRVYDFRLARKSIVRALSIVRSPL